MREAAVHTVCVVSLQPYKAMGFWSCHSGNSKGVNNQISNGCTLQTQGCGTVHVHPLSHCQASFGYWNMAELRCVKKGYCEKKSII